MLKICKNCNQEKEHHSKGYCYNCYKKYIWERKKGICERCKREIFLHAKGLCSGCYNFVFHLEKTKNENYKKYHNIGFELYKEITKSCVLCSFDKVVDLHHLDENKKNNLRENLIGLCPNHHKMLHNFNYRQEVQESLRKRGFKIPEDIKINFERRKIINKSE